MAQTFSIAHLMEKIMPNYPKRLRRADAAAYLRDVHGLVISTATLAKYAVVGGGPAYVKHSRFPLYEIEELDRYAVSRISKPVRSTSGYAA